MARFSIGVAIRDAFDLIRRRPLAVFVWGLLLIAPALVSLALLFPAMGEMVAGMPGPGEAPDEAAASQLMGEMMQFQAASMLLNLGQMLAMVLVYTAVFRAILRPQETRLFSLRVGMDELRVAVVGLAIGIGFYAAILVFMLVGLAVGFAAWSAGDSALLVGVICLLVLIMLAAVFLGLARVSMIAPASVLYRDFAFVQGWRMAAGKTLPLFGMMLLIFLMIVLIEVALVIAGVLVFAGVGAASGFDWVRTDSDANPFAGVNAWMVANWYWAVLGGLAGSFVYGLLMTLSIAPFASACRQLAEGGTPSAADEGSPARAG